MKRRSASELRLDWAPKPRPRRRSKAEAEARRREEEGKKKEAERKTQQKIQAGCLGCFGLIAVLAAIGYVVSGTETPEEKAAYERAWKWCEDYAKLREAGADESEKLGWVGRGAFVTKCQQVKEKEFLAEIRKEAEERKASQKPGGGPAYWAIMQRNCISASLPTCNGEWSVLKSEDGSDAKEEVFPFTEGGRVECRGKLQAIKRRWSEGTPDSMFASKTSGYTARALSYLCWKVQQNAQGEWPRYESTDKELNETVWIPKDPFVVGKEEAVRWAEEGSQAKGNCEAKGDCRQ